MNGTTSFDDIMPELAKAYWQLVFKAAEARAASTPSTGAEQ